MKTMLSIACLLAFCSLAAGCYTRHDHMHDAGSHMKEAGHHVGEAAEEAGEATADRVKDAGKAIERGADKVH